MRKNAAEYVKNRDIPALYQVTYLMQEVSAAENMRAWQWARMTSIKSHLSGMPGGRGLPSGLDAAFARLTDAEERLAEKLLRYTDELQAAESILNSIPSREMRTFVMLKYMMDASDRAVMETLNMSRYHFGQARRCVEDAPDMASVPWKDRYAVR